MLKSEDCNEPRKPIIKNECLDIENYVIEEKYEPVEDVKCEELHIKDELDSGEEGYASEPAPEVEDCNGSGGNGSSQGKGKIKKSSSNEKRLHFCPICPYSSKWKRNVDRHKLTHPDLDRQNSSEWMKFSCHYCNYKSNRKDGLNRHILMIHEREIATVYSCQHCTFKTVLAEYLHKHLKLHEENVIPHKCPGCEKEFYAKRSLDNHFLRKHDKLQHLITSRIYDCKFCTYKSIYIQDARRHIRIHVGKNTEKFFKCHNCNYFTLYKASLVKHLQAVHSNFKQHQCPSCKKGFNLKVTLDSHIVSIHGDNAVLLKSIQRKIHECTVCSFKTVKKHVFERHIKAKHK